MSDDTFVLCIDNRGYGASLEPRKVYRAMSDPTAEKHAMVRVIDESNEDYLFPAKLFIPVAVPPAAARAFRTSGRARGPRSASRVAAAARPSQGSRAKAR